MFKNITKAVANSSKSSLNKNSTMFSALLANPCLQYKSSKYVRAPTLPISGGMKTSVNGIQMQARSFGVHARGYNDFYDVPAPIFHEVNSAMMGAHNVTDYSHIFRKYKEYLTDSQIAYAFYDIAVDGHIRTEDFWNVILPRVKEQCATLDRQCTPSLLHIIQGAGEMQLQDNELWETLESKLIDEGLLRYFSIDEMA